ncbi:MAG: hypothetical protein K6F15_04125 [Treponema sp.]|nr:hypothetical protein [Treponema sp.]
MTKQEQYKYNCWYYKATLKDSEKRYKNYFELMSRFWNWLLKLSAGSFGLSFVFIDKFVDLQNAKNIKILEFSWICFALCLIFSLVDFLLSASDRMKTIKNNWIAYENEVNKTNKEIIKGHFEFIDSLLIALNILLFSAGIICLIIFVFLNLT